MPTKCGNATKMWCFIAKNNSGFGFVNMNEVCPLRTSKRFTCALMSPVRQGKTNNLEMVVNVLKDNGRSQCQGLIKPRDGKTEFIIIVGVGVAR
ncbi:hypothetical protein GBF38_010336, partial [Nibea albiflora]